MANIDLLIHNLVEFVADRSVPWFGTVHGESLLIRQAYCCGLNGASVS